MKLTARSFSNLLKDYLSSKFITGLKSLSFSYSIQYINKASLKNFSFSMDGILKLNEIFFNLMAPMAHLEAHFM